MPELARESAPFHTYPDLEIAFLGCSIHVSGFDFCNRSSYPSGYFYDGECFCNNENSVATLAHCYSVAYPEQMPKFMEKCNTQYNGTLTPAKIEDALAFYEEHARTPEDEAINSSEVHIQRRPMRTPKKVFAPVRVTDAKILLYRATYDQFLGNYNRSIRYGIYLVAFLLAIMVIVAVGNWGKVLVPAIFKRMNGPLVNALRRHVTLPALVGKLRTDERRFLWILDHLAPTRAETLILVAFTGLVIYLANVNIHYVEGDPFFHTRAAAYQRYYAVRTGIFASYLMPFSVLFAGRNNLLQWFTKWEYSTFVMLHRWISRILVIMIIIHSLCYAELLRSRRHHIRGYIYWGVLGFYSGVIILIHSLLVLRRKWYEVFLVLHIVLALAFLVGAWFHVKDLYFLWFYYCSAWLWVLDRAIRVHSLCQFGFPVAKVQLYENECLKVRVPKPPGFRAEGGGHCFLHFVTWWCFWQSHPFTYTEIGSDIVFYVKVKNGVTDSLRKYLESNPEKAAYIRVAVEGSYGEATPAFRYDSSVFVAGGNGIPGIYAEALQVLKHTRETKRIKIIWVVRDYHSLLWFFEELEELKDIPIETDVYVTRPTSRLTGPVSDKLALLQNTYTHNNYYSSGVNEDPIDHLKRRLSHVKFLEGRPDIQKIVESSVEQSPRSTCFVSCGHPKMVDELRHEVVHVIGKGTLRVDYFEQLQVWA